MATPFPSSFAMSFPCTTYYSLIKIKEQMILTPAKHNHKCTKKINQLSSRWLSKTFLNNFQNIFVKSEKIDKFGLNYDRYMVQPLALRILRVFFLKIPRIKSFSPGELLLLPLGGEYCPHLYKYYKLSYYYYYE